MKNSHNRKLHIIPSLCAIPIIAIFLLTFSVNVFASSGQTYFPMQQNENGSIPSGVSDYIESNLVNTDTQYYFIYGPFTTWGDGSSAYYYLKFDKDSSGSLYGVLNNAHNAFYLISSGTLSNFFNNTVVLYNTGYVVEWNYAYIDNYSILNNQYDSSVYNSGVSYISNFDLTTDSDYLLLMFDVPVVVPEPSDPTPFDDTGLNLDSSLNASSVPSVPSAPTLQFDPLPTWDSQAPFESLGEIIKWGVSVLGVLLNAIITTVSNWIQFIGNLLSYLIQKLLDFIKAVINWLYSQFLNWLNPYLKILYFIGQILFNEEDQVSIFDLIGDFRDSVISSLSSLFSNSWFSSYWSTFETKVSDAFNYFSKIVLFFTTLIVLGTDPTTHEFSIPYLTHVLLVPSTQNVIDLVLAHDEFSVFPFISAVGIKGQYIFNQITSVTPSKTFHVPSCYYHGVEIGNFDLDFSWYDNYKVYCDTIINGFLITGYIIWLFVTFKDHLRGHFVHDVEHDVNIFRG